MKNVEGFYLLEKHKQFVNSFFFLHYVFQETKLVKLKKHLCSQAPDLVLGFTKQTKLNIVKQKDQSPCSGKIKSEQ